MNYELFKDEDNARRLQIAYFSSVEKVTPGSLQTLMHLSAEVAAGWYKMPTESPRWNSVPRMRSPAPPAEPNKDTIHIQLPLASSSRKIRDPVAELVERATFLGKRGRKSADEEPGSSSGMNTGKREDQLQFSKKSHQEFTIESGIPRRTPRVHRKKPLPEGWVDSSIIPDLLSRHSGP
jgi:hypothetical protein